MPLLLAQPGPWHVRLHLALDPTLLQQLYAAMHVLHHTMQRLQAAAQLLASSPMTPLICSSAALAAPAAALAALALSGLRVPVLLLALRDLQQAKGAALLPGMVPCCFCRCLADAHGLPALLGLQLPH
jgi:hypothetical protein